MIPFLLHQTWKTRTLPSPEREWSASWRLVNPGLECRIYDDAGLKAFVADCYPDLLPALLRLPLVVQKTDLFRYLVVHRFGGFYADVDTICLSPLAPLVRPGDAMLAGLEMDAGDGTCAEAANDPNYLRPRQFLQWLFGAEAGHPLLLRVAQSIARELERLSDRELEASRSDTTFTLQLTGPWRFTRELEAWLSEGREPGFRLLPRSTWGFNPWYDPPSRRAVAQSLHGYAGSWRPRQAPPG
jgi:mannosyltransferase OCH1-like enzyme